MNNPTNVFEVIGVLDAEITVQVAEGGGFRLTWPQTKIALLCEWVTCDRIATHVRFDAPSELHGWCDEHVHTDAGLAQRIAAKAIDAWKRMQ